MLRRHGYRKALLFFVLAGVLVVPVSLFFDVRDLCAHSPHDPIDGMAVSPGYAGDRTLFIIISDQLLRSTDEGFSWKALVNGLDNKHLLSAIAIAPSDRTDRTLFVSSHGDGVYRSRDGGNSWVKVNDGIDDLDIGLLAVHPDYGSTQVVLAAGSEGGLYRTANGGDSWHRVIDGSIRVTAMAFSPDPDEGLMLVGDHRGMLRFSEDNGENWSRTLRIPDVGAITVIAVSPRFSSDGTFFVGTEKGGILRTADSGASFSGVNDGLPFTIRGKYGTLRKSREGPVIRPDEKNIISIAISPDFEDDSTVFATMWNEAVFKSVDGGDTWRKYPLGLTCDYQADSPEYKSPHFRDLRISSSFEDDQTVFLGGFDGLFKSTDAGRHWTQMETLPLSLIKGLALSPGDADGRSVAVTMYGGGTCTTDDRGTTWAINNRGLETTRLSDIVFSPKYQTDSTLFSASRGYLLKSVDEGRTWEKIPLEYTPHWTTDLRRRIKDILESVGMPAFISRSLLTVRERDKPFATVVVVSPDFPSDNTIFFGTRHHGFYKSVDGGRTVSATWSAMGETITSLVISPGFSSDGTLFAGLRGAGVYKTRDAGHTWEPTNNGLTFVEGWQSPTQHQITKKDIQLVISPHYEVDGSVFAACSEGLFKTEDRGESWRELRDPAFGEDSYIIGMAISPNYEHDETLIISIRGRGLFKTDDGGITFTKTGSGLIRNNHAIEYLAFSGSYAADHVIYAASDEELFVSADGGNTWELIPRPVRYEDMREVVRFEGEWRTAESDDSSAGSVSYSDVARDKAILNFVGTGVSLISTKSNDQGIARVYIDGNYVDEVDQFSDTRQAMVASYSITGLPYGPHTIVVEVTGTKNPRSAGYRIEVDAFDIAP